MTSEILDAGKPLFEAVIFVPALSFLKCNLNGSSPSLVGAGASVGKLNAFFP